MMLRMKLLRRRMKRMIMLMLRKMRWRLMMLRMMRSRGEEDDDVKNDDVEEEGRSQDRDPHFVRARAVEMRVDISEEPLCARIYR